MSETTKPDPYLTVLTECETRSKEIAADLAKLVGEMPDVSGLPRMKLSWTADWERVRQLALMSGGVEILPELKPPGIVAWLIAAKTNPNLVFVGNADDFDSADFIASTSYQVMKLWDRLASWCRSKLMAPMQASGKINLAAQDLSRLTQAAASLVDSLEAYNAEAKDNEFAMTVPVVISRTQAGMKIAEAEVVMGSYAPTLEQGDLLPAMEITPQAIAIPFASLYSLLREARRGQGPLGRVLLWPAGETVAPDATKAISMVRRVVDGLRATPSETARENAAKSAEDETAYRLLTEFIDPNRFPNVKAINKALKANPWIRRRRPIGKNGEPIPNRKEIHAGDWHQFKLQGQAVDLLDLPTSIVEQALAASERQKEILQQRKAGRK